ncbi:MAG: hypothetical protein PHH01_02965 [Patescibacteria group bacterium]|nr:hypothetical protein [Patescibacteria group bacterium]
MKKGASATLIIIIILIVAAVGWYFFFRGDKTKDKADTNQTNQTEDLGLDSVIDTTTLGEIDTESDLEDVDNYIEDLTPPDTNLDIKFTQ